MGILGGLFGGNLKVEGEIGYLGLTDWWFFAFNDDERRYIESVYQPLGHPSGGSPLTKGKIVAMSQTAADLLSALGGWFKKKPDDRDLALRILKKAEEEALAGKRILPLHFTYQEMIRLHYRWRDEFPDALESAIGACRKQIEIAPRAARAFRRQGGLPIHIGYQQLAIILEKSDQYSDAIDISKQAQSQGWSGGWAKRISRLEKKLQKQQRDTHKTGSS